MGSQRDVPTHTDPLKHCNRLESIIICITDIDLEFLRLNGDLILSRRSCLISLDEFDVGTRTIDPNPDFSPVVWKTAVPRGRIVNCSPAVYYATYAYKNPVSSFCRTT
jgi:hypothetical protein